MVPAAEVELPVQAEGAAGRSRGDVLGSFPEGGTLWGGVIGRRAWKFLLLDLNLAGVWLDLDLRTLLLPDLLFDPDVAPVLEPLLLLVGGFQLDPDSRRRLHVLGEEPLQLVVVQF